MWQEASFQVPCKAGGEPCLLLRTPINSTENLAGETTQACCTVVHISMVHQLCLQSQNKTEPTTLNSLPTPLPLSSRDALLKKPPPADHQGFRLSLPLSLPLSLFPLTTSGLQALRRQKPWLSLHCCLPHRAWHGALHTSAAGMNDSQRT